MTDTTLTTKPTEEKTDEKPATSKLEDHPNWNPVTGEVAVMTREEAEELATRGREVEPRGTAWVVKKKS